MKVWDCSRRTVSRRLKILEEMGFLRRLTFAPRRKSGGKWEQLRYLFLIVGKVKRTLVRHFGSRLEQSVNHSDQNQPQAGKARPLRLDFKDYLSIRDDVPLNSFLFWLRRWGADPRSIGYLRRLWVRIKNRPDILEAILWDSEEGGYKGREKVGFLVSEIKARLPLINQLQLTKHISI